MSCFRFMQAWQHAWRRLSLASGRTLRWDSRKYVSLLRLNETLGAYTHIHTHINAKSAPQSEIASLSKLTPYS